MCVRVCERESESMFVMKGFDEIPDVVKDLMLLYVVLSNSVSKLFSISLVTFLCVLH